MKKKRTCEVIFGDHWFGLADNEVGRICRQVSYDLETRGMKMPYADIDVSFVCKDHAKPVGVVIVPKVITIVGMNSNHYLHGEQLEFMIALIRSIRRHSRARIIHQLHKTPVLTG